MSEFTSQILRFESLPSTNVEAASRAAQGAAEGLCVVAGEQTAGRGRLQRRWNSPKDAGLYFSVVLRPRFAQSSWPLLTLMAAVAVHDSLLAACRLQTDIKWPNDILVNEKKLCGILAETVETSLGRAVVVGIGINLTDRAFPAELEAVATSIEACIGRPPDLEAVLEALVRLIGKHYDTLQLSTGPAEIVREWSARSSYAEAKRVRVDETGGASGVGGAGESFVGTTRGLEPDGALRVETDDGDKRGEIRIVRAGDVASVRPDQTA